MANPVWIDCANIKEKNGECTNKKKKRKKSLSINDYQNSLFLISSFSPLNTNKYNFYKIIELTRSILFIQTYLSKYLTEKITNFEGKLSDKRIQFTESHGYNTILNNQDIIIPRIYENYGYPSRPPNNFGLIKGLRDGDLKHGPPGGKYVKYVKVDQSCLVVKRWFHECLVAERLKTRWWADIVALSPPINIIIPDRWQNNRGQTRAPGARLRLTPDTLMNIQLFDI